MAIPDFQTLMLPLLKFANDDQEHTLGEAIEVLSKNFHLTDSERKERLPSGQQAVFDNRIAWTKSYLKKAQLLDFPKRGRFVITDRGKEVLAENPAQINMKFLTRFPEYNEFRAARKETSSIDADSDGSKEQTPRELIEIGHKKIRDELEVELLKMIKGASPNFFEQLVVDILVKMGYGGSRNDAGQVIGQSGDEGIDGTIKEDKLGLDIIYIQAKKWEGTVSRPEIQKFAGALQGKRAKKGIFLTTSTFSKEALQFVSSIDAKIVLIDGPQLAKLMIENNVGISTETTYELKRIDSDYFSEYE